MVPDLTFYHGRAVEQVVETSEGWDLVLTGEVLIHNTDSEISLPVVEGALFRATTFSEGVTTMFFSNGVALELTPTEYAIADQKFGDNLFWPQRPAGEQGAPEEPEIVDPSPGRIKIGP